MKATAVLKRVVLLITLVAALLIGVFVPMNALYVDRTPAAQAQNPSEAWRVFAVDARTALTDDTTFNSLQWGGPVGGYAQYADVFLHVDWSSAVTTTTAVWYMDVSADNTHWATAPYSSTMQLSGYDDFNVAWQMPVQGMYMRVRADVTGPTTTKTYTPVINVVLHNLR
jgi:hypothetical protein